MKQQSTDAVLLILAPPGDLAADQMATAVPARGIRTCRPHDLNELGVDLSGDENGRVSVRFVAGGAPCPVRWIVHRGLPTGDATGPAESDFLLDERVAAWWTALAFFPGPVLNRPTPEGPMVNLEEACMTRRVAGVRAATGTMTTQVRGPASAPLQKLVRVRDGSHLGWISAGDLVSLPTHEAVRVLPVDPARTRFLLIAGTSVFDLASGCVMWGPMRRSLDALTRRCVEMEALLALLVVTETASGLDLVHASAVPRLELYERVAEAAHSAVLDWLIHDADLPRFAG